MGQNPTMGLGLTTIFESPHLSQYATPGPLRSLYDGDIGFDAPVVYANFVSSLDGVVALDDRTPPSVISGKSEADRFVMALLRACAQAVLVGAGTMRAEPNHLWTPEFIYPSLAGEFAALRRELEFSRSPELFVLTRSGDIDPSYRALQKGATVITARSRAAELQKKLPKSASVLTAPSEEISILEVLGIIRSKGYSTILTEGGPTLLGQFVRGDLLDELFLTVAPLLAGRSEGIPRLSLIEGVAFDPDRLLEANLLSVKRDSSHLFLRYRFAHEDPNMRRALRN